METKMQKWGNSLAVRIPQSYAKELGLKEGTKIEIIMNDGVIVLKSVVKPSLDALLKGVNENNIHSETQTGKIIGNEIW